MQQSLQYITDDLGNKTSVIIPYSDWEKFNERYRKLLNKIQILTGIKNGILEVKEARKKGVKLQSLTDFLNECKS